MSSICINALLEDVLAIDEEEDSSSRPDDDFISSFSQSAGALSLLAASATIAARRSSALSASSKRNDPMRGGTSPSGSVFDAYNHLDADVRDVLLRSYKADFEGIQQAALERGSKSKPIKPHSPTARTPRPPPSTSRNALPIPRNRVPRVLSARTSSRRISSPKQQAVRASRLSQQLEETKRREIEHSLHEERQARVEVNRHNQFVMPDAEKARRLLTFIMHITYIEQLKKRGEDTRALLRLQRIIRRAIMIRRARRSQNWSKECYVPYTPKEMRSIDLFKEFPDDVCVDLMKVCRPMHRDEGDTIVSEGDRPEFAYFILSGTVEVVGATKGNNTMCRPAVFAEGVLSSFNYPTPLGVRCGPEQIAVARLPRFEFVRALRKLPPEVASKFEATVLNRRETMLSHAFALTKSEATECPIFNENFVDDILLESAVLKCFAPGSTFSLHDVGLFYVQKGA
eukprot:PhM_4_TR11633/c0_g1_i2/m.6259